MCKRNIIGLLIVFSTSIQAFAQSFDEARMNRDLKVAENILTTLTNENGSRSLFNSVESNYIPEYGVIFNVPQSKFIYGVSGKSVVQSTGQGTYVFSTEYDDEEKKEQKKLSKEEWDKMVDEKIQEQMSIFLVDYADLIGQLKPSHHIVVQTKSNNSFIISNSRRHSKLSQTSARIKKSDLTSFKQGKISREEAINRISFTSAEDKETSKDIELFATIFSRLYEPDLSETYYMSSRNLNYTELEGLGVTFNMKVYSSSSNEGKHTITTTGESGLSSEERDRRVNEMYPSFKQTFLENVMDYGRTIRSLKSEEMLVFKVKLTQCKGCEMPEAIEVVVKGKTLKDYDSGDLTREDGIKQISFKELGD